MNISELENRVGITKQNIRFYEKKGLLLPARNEENNYRQYTEEDVKTLQVVKMLRKLDISIEDIARILNGEVSLPKVIEPHLEVLQKKQRELDASIEVCKSLRNEELKNLNAERVLQRMDEMEAQGGMFMSIIHDYKKVAKVEAKKKFSFMPDNMALNPGEFTEALCKYADENDLNIVITKECMYPVFEIDGVEYTAERRFGRFGAVIYCTMTHPEEAEAEIGEVPKNRRRVFVWIMKYSVIAGLVLYCMVLNGNIMWGIFVAIFIIPILYWVYKR